MGKSIVRILREKKRLAGALSMILVLCMLFTSIDIPSVLAESKTEGQQNALWTGAETAPASGAGTETEPYLISTAEELAYVVKNLGGGKYYKLTADIWLNDVAASNWYENTGNRAWYSLEGNFQGHLDGDGHIVYGLWYSDSAAGRFSGLIPKLASGSVKNIGVRYARVYATHSAGGIVGYAYTGSTKVIDKCFADETVSVRLPNSAGGGAGGIVGLISGVSKAGEQVDISNCYTKASVQATSGRANGIVGDSWQSKYTVKNCYSVSARPFTAGNANKVSALWTKAGGSLSTEAVYQNIYSNTAKDAAYGEWTPYEYVSNLSAMKGEAAKNAMPGLDYMNVFRIVENDTPKLRAFPEQTIWTGAETKPANGTGTSENPYQIGTAEELAYVIKNHGGADNYYKLTADIYLNDVTAENWYENTGNHRWYSAQGSATGLNDAFKGHIDGDGHIVYGLWYPETTNLTTADMFTGLIPKMSAGSVKKLGIRYARVNAINSAGGLIGYTYAGTTKTIDQCFADDTVTLSGSKSAAGGIVGEISGVNKEGDQVNILNCYSKAKVYGASGSGKGNGIIGTSWQSKHTMKNCYAAWGRPFTAGNKNGVSALWTKAGGSLSTEAVYQNIYSNTAKDATYGEWTPYEYVSNLSEMKGEAAKTSMPGLDYMNVFRIVENDTPKLRVFPEQAEVSYVSLSLDGSIGINYYVRLSDTVKNSDSAYMQFAVGTDEFTKVYVKDVLEDTREIDGETFYLFTCHVNSIQMTENVKAQFVVNENSKGPKMEYSVQKYAETILKDASMTQATKDLVKALLNYGSAAQAKYAPETAPANSILEDTDKILNAFTIGADDYKSANTGATEGICFYGSSLILDSCTTIRYYFTLDDGKQISDYKFTLAGEGAESKVLNPVQRGSYYCVDIPNINAYELGTMYTLTVTRKGSENEEEGTLAVVYGAMSYVKNMYSKSTTNAETKDIVMALYWYYQNAKAYLRENSSN